MKRIIRIDDRLIHGQVIIGWVDNLAIRRLFLAHDDIPEDIIELYSNMLSSTVSFTEIQLNNVQNNPFTHLMERSLIIVRDISALHRHGELFLKFEPDLINIGGMRTEKDKDRIADFVYLSYEDKSMMLDISEMFECRINARELPDSREYDIISIIKNNK